jgi:hypothetical protein
VFTLTGLASEHDNHGGDQECDHGRACAAQGASSTTESTGPPFEFGERPLLISDEIFAGAAFKCSGVGRKLRKKAGNASTRA